MKAVPAILIGLVQPDGLQLWFMAFGMQGFCCSRAIFTLHNHYDDFPLG